jgi:hypothetical protein
MNTHTLAHSFRSDTSDTPCTRTCAQTKWRPRTSCSTNPRASPGHTAGNFRNHHKRDLRSCRIYTGARFETRKGISADSLYLPTCTTPLSKKMDCLTCGTKADILCGQCRTVAYCGYNCQKNDWFAGHAFECIGAKPKRRSRSRRRRSKSRSRSRRRRSKSRSRSRRRSQSRERRKDRRSQSRERRKDRRSRSRERREAPATQTVWVSNVPERRQTVYYENPEPRQVPAETYQKPDSDFN